VLNSYTQQSEDGNSDPEQIGKDKSDLELEREDNQVEQSGQLGRGEDERRDNPDRSQNSEAASPEPFAKRNPPLPQKPASPAASSNSSLSYIEYDRAAVEAEKIAKRASLASQSQSAANSTFQPILPEEIRSRQPTPRPSTHASRPSTIPSPFLAAAPARYQSDPFATQPSNRYSSFGGASSRHVPQQTSLETPHIDLDTPFEPLESLKALDVGKEGQGKVARGRGRESVEEWTRRFIEADKQLKEDRPVRDDRRDEIEERRRFEEFEADDEEESTHQRQLQAQPSSPRLSSPTLSSPRNTTSFSPAHIKKKNTVKIKHRRDSLSDVASDSSFDRNMTTERTIAMLPKRLRKTGKKRIRVENESDIEEESEGGEEESDEEETDYDE